MERTQNLWWGRKGALSEIRESRKNCKLKSRESGVQKNLEDIQKRTRVEKIWISAGWGSLSSWDSFLELMASQRLVVYRGCTIWLHMSGGTFLSLGTSRTMRECQFAYATSTVVVNGTNKTVF